MRTLHGSGNAWADAIDREREKECPECGGVDEHFDGCPELGAAEFEADRKCDEKRERGVE
jgi:hypothetical protein